MHGWPFEVRNGALISYGPGIVENFQHAAIYVDRILRGAKIAELPFEEPTEIKLAINLRTARSIGLVIPPTLLSRADVVIE
jgi:putative ABC transport system substrate-binding protein